IALATRCRQCAWVDWRSSVCSRTVPWLPWKSRSCSACRLSPLVLLAADRAALGLVSEVAEHEPRLDEAPVFLQGAGERQLAAGGLQARDKHAGGHGAVPERGGASDEVIPAVADEPVVDRVREQPPAGVASAEPGW